MGYSSKHTSSPSRMTINLSRVILDLVNDIDLVQCTQEELHIKSH